MAEAALTEATSRLLRSLAELRPNKKDVRRRIGHKAGTLARLQAADVHIPETWVLDASGYLAFTGAHLPRKHDLKNLIKLSGTREGDERCARAYQELLRAPLPDEVIAAVQQLWERVFRGWPGGVAVRPSIAAASANPGRAARHLVTQIGLDSAEQVLDAIHTLWADSVLACSSQAFAEAEVSDAAVAIVLQETIASEHAGVLTRVAQPGALSDADQYLGVEPSIAGASRRLQLLVPWSEGEGASNAPPRLKALRDSLQAAGHEQLQEAADAVQGALGPRAVVRFCVSSEPYRGRRIHVVAADDSPQWNTLRGGHEHTGWLQLPFAGGGNTPPTRLTQSVFDQAVVAATDLTLAQQHAKLEGKTAALGRWGARSYLNLDVLLQALVDMPLVRPEEVLAALGGSEALRRNVAGRAASRSRSWLRQPRITSALVREHLALDSLVARERRSIEVDLRMVTRMDLTLLPSDAIGTTLRSAQALLERVVELWVRLGVSLLGSRAALRAMIQRQLPKPPRKWAIWWQRRAPVRSPAPWRKS